MKTKKQRKQATGGAVEEVRREPAFTPHSEKGSYLPGEAQQARIDDAIRKTVRAHFGETVAVEGCLGVRYQEPSRAAGWPYQRYLLANGHTVFVSLATGHITVSDNPAAKNSYTVSLLLKRKARKAARVKKAAVQS